VTTLTHGHSGRRRQTPEYRTWKGIKTRCFNQNCADYAAYGGRGITVCERWRSNFLNFLADMGPKPSPLHSIDRIDGTGAYEPGNCRWATSKEQSRNVIRNVVVEHNGVRLCLRDACAAVGIPYSTAKKRIRLGQSPQQAVSMPVDPARSRAAKIAHARRGR
jgi:hypothetical protein